MAASVQRSWLWANCPVSASQARPRPSLLRPFSPSLPNPRIAQLRLLSLPSLHRTHAWFKFGNSGLDSENAGMYASQGRDDFDRDDVEQYFNYMGMLATEGTYDKMEGLLNKGIHPVDILLLLAATEGDKPKLEELLRAGASYDVPDVEGRTALDRAQDDEVRELILNYSKTLR